MVGQMCTWIGLCPQLATSMLCVCEPLIWLGNYYMEPRHYLSSQGADSNKGLPLNQLLCILRLTSCQHLMRNHSYLALSCLGLLAPEVSEQISVLKAQGTNSTEFKSKFGPMPERTLLWKNVRLIITPEIRRWRCFDGCW